MKSKAVLAFATFALLFSTTSLAQESSHADFEELLDALNYRRTQMRYLLHTVIILVAFGHVAQAGDILPEAAQKELESYVGTWEGTIDLDGKSSPARWTAAWAPGKQCLIIHEEYDLDDGTNKLTALMGYDRIKKQVVNLGFRTDGGNRTLIFSETMTEGKGTGDGPDGEVWNSDFRIKKNGNELTFDFEATSPEARDFSIRLRRKP